ncbi:MAG TPA: glutamate--tRNA ligase [Verrucomicrobiae bacterium]|nr:glutamate--tRNA ligase [Verrucomicrobiae bacterium]
MSIRTRFAPSPTGFLHVGNFRTALFAWLVARHANGTFVLRLEDTDQKREVEGSAHHLLKCMHELGMHYDEGPDIGGPFGPYRQSERLAIYKSWAQKLIDSGRAYADPYTAEELQGLKDTAKAEKRAFLYRDHRPKNPPIWDGTTPLRFKSEPKNYTWHDEVMGELSAGAEAVDDFILIKSDGFPTYNFAHIVDDAEMQITHIIRGQEFIASQPNYLNLYEALGLTPPVFATVPHILAATGGKKLSKRDGAKDVLDYLADGITKEALINFIASLGWNDGTEQEVFSEAELIEKFSLDRVQRSGARFDEQRLLWLNGQWIRRLSLDELHSRSISFWPKEANNAPEVYKKQVLALVQDRLKTLADLPLLTRYFFAEPTPDLSLITGNKQLKKLTPEEQKALLQTCLDSLEATDFTPEALQEALNKLLETTGQKPGILFGLLRIVTTWAPFSPGLAETMALLGKERVLERIRNFMTA